MKKLTEIVEKIKEFISKLSKKQKTILIGVIVFLISALTFFFVYSSVMKFGLLYSDLDSSDSKYIHQQLVDMGLEVKIRGKGIYVPREKVDELRLTFSPEIKGGSKGFELLDQSSGFGFTDEEFLIQKQRIVQGELERTIRNFSQVKDSRVHISPANTSIFMTNQDFAKASVYLKLHPGESLSSEQVKSIIHLVSAAWNNLPFENVEVVDGRMNLLSMGVYDGNQMNMSSSMDTYMDLERQFEYELQKNILSIIEPVLGANNIRVKVNAQLDFDSKERTEIIIDENNVPISEHTIVEENGSSVNSGGGPLDNNMTNEEIQGGVDGEDYRREESTINYEVSKKEVRVIEAPGAIERITVSLVYDGNVTKEMESKLQSLINGVIGFNGERGDTISIVGMEFNGDKNGIFESSNRNLIPIIIAVIVGIIIGVILLIMVKRKKRKNIEESLSEDIKLRGAYVNTTDSVAEEEIQKGIKNNMLGQITPENKLLEDEIKSYAANKPHQVVDIIKSWLMEDTR